MKSCTIKDESNYVEIGFSEELTHWKELMVLAIDSIKGLGFLSDELNNLQDEWSKDDYNVIYKRK